MEVVPGVTAAAAAAAQLKEGLTERGQTDALVIVTGKCRPGDPAPNWAEYMRPGTTLAVYMGVGAADPLSRSLIEAGVPPCAAVDICVEVTKPEQRLLRTCLKDLQAHLADNDVTGSAVIFVRLPKLQTGQRLEAA